MEETQEHWSQAVITAPAPARGWRQASTPRRACAVAAAPVLALWTLWLAVPAPLWSISGGALAAAAAVVYAMLGPTVCYALARALRPHRTHDGERVVRHPLAAAGTAYGLPLILAQPLVDVTRWSSNVAETGGLSAFESDDGFIVTVLFGLGAAGLGVLTVAWGLVALLVRAAALVAAAAASRRRLSVEELS